MAKSLRGPCKVHFLQGKNGHYCFPAGQWEQWFQVDLVDHHQITYYLLLDSAPNLGPLISRWEINRFENCWYKCQDFKGSIKLLFQQFLNLSSLHQGISGPILGALSNNRWSGGTISVTSLWSITKPACDALQELMANAFPECVSDDPVLCLSARTRLGTSLLFCVQFGDLLMIVFVWTTRISVRVVIWKARVFMSFLPVPNSRMSASDFLMKQGLPSLSTPWRQATTTLRRRSATMDTDF